MTSLLSFDELISAVNGISIGFAGSTDNFGFTSVVTDSRNVVSGSLFVPLVGQNQDGHKYVPQAAEKGASVVFINNSEYQKNTGKYMDFSGMHKNICIIVVKDTLGALQNAAAAYVAKFPKLIKVGITGSAGKTTTKELTVALLKKKYNVICNEGNFNSETGLPLSVFKIRAEHEVGVFEMGMNRENEIGEIAGVLKPQYAAITNIGTAHIGILGSRQNIAAEKRKIFDYIPASGAAVIPESDDFSEFLGENVKGRIVKYGTSVSTEESGVLFVSDNCLDGTSFTVEGYEVNFKMPGVYNFQNVLAALALARCLGVPADKAAEALNEVEGVSGRTESVPLRLRSGINVTLLKDCYNANPDSMISVMDFCSKLDNVNHKIYVLGDMLELGTRSAEEHARIGAEAVASDPYMLIFIGREMAYAAAAAKSAGFENTLYIQDMDDEGKDLAAQFLIDCTSEGDMILLKGSHGMQMERIIPLISGEESGVANG